MPMYIAALRRTSSAGGSTDAAWRVQASAYSDTSAWSAFLYASSSGLKSIGTIFVPRVRVMIGSIGCMGRPTRRMVDSRSRLTAASASNFGGASIAAIVSSPTGPYVLRTAAMQSSANRAAVCASLMPTNERAAMSTSSNRLDETPATFFPARRAAA